jgi:Protein of unknown function (DUF3047)
MTRARTSAWLLVALSSCAAPLVAQGLSPLSPAEGAVSSAWRFVGLPTSKNPVPATRFEWAVVQGEGALRVSTQSSYGTWVHDLPPMAPARLQWRWRLDQPLSGGKNAPNVLLKSGDDAALKVCVLFDLPLDRVPLLERTVLRAARLMSGEDLPAATVCYVWDSVQAAGLQGANPYSRRVRFITLQGLGSPLGQWQRETRDVAQDFAQVFADELPKGAGLPAVRAVLIGADSDNTGAQSLGWVQSIQWLP